VVIDNNKVKPDNKSVGRLGVDWCSDIRIGSKSPVKQAKSAVSSVHHLHNARADQTLKLLLNGQTIRHEPNPLYLGVTLDRTLSFREHLRKTACQHPK